MSIMISEYFAELAKVEEEIKEELLEEILDYEYEAELGSYDSGEIEDEDWEAYERTLLWLEAENKEKKEKEDWGKQMAKLKQLLEKDEEMKEQEKQLKDSFFAMWMRENCDEQYRKITDGRAEWVTE